MRSTSVALARAVRPCLSASLTISPFSQSTSVLRPLSSASIMEERAAGSIVSDLEAAGYLTRTKVGRRNTYDVHLDQPFRHPAEAEHTIGELVSVLLGDRRA